jgi:PQQ-dependent catabolism-associated CXXCW motif protein
VIRALVVLALLGVPGWAPAEQVRAPDGYRMDHYRAPVPDTLRGAEVIGAEAAHALWLGKAAAFVDVMPRAPKPDNLPEGTLWYDAPRQSIPGAVWLPNTGYGALAAETEAYFRQGLEAVTSGDRGHPLVIFCPAECWMSWNAAKRALELGYDRVYWMPGGTDVWSAAGYPTQAVTAEPAR